jgi:hypothetical protein
MKKWFAAFLLPVVFACQNREILTLDSIPTKDISGKELTISPEILGPRLAFLTDSALVLFDNRHEAGFLSFFHKETGALKESFGRIGRGPGEFLSPRVHDTQKGLILTSIDGGVYTVDDKDSLKVVSLPLLRRSELAGSNFLFQTDDSTAVSVKDGMEQFLILNMNTGKTESISRYPLKIGANTLPDILNNVIFQAQYSYHQDSRRIFAAYKYHPIVSVIDAGSFDIISHTQFDGVKNSLERDGENLTYLNPTLGYTFTAVSDAFFYALYQNADKETLRKNIQRSEIHKYDLSGNFVERFILDRPVYHFAIEKNDSKIYSLSLNEEFLPEVVVFDLL